MKHTLLGLVFVLGTTSVARAQHQHHVPQPAPRPATAAPAKKRTPPKAAAPVRKKPAQPAATRPVSVPPKKQEAAASLADTPASVVPNAVVDTPELHRHHAPADTVATDREDSHNHTGHEDMEGMNADTAMHGGHGTGMRGNMSHILSLHLPMNRNGSGTGWNPDESPMYMYMRHTQDWMFMLHGNVFVRYNKQDLTGKGVRGDAQWDAPNMLMAMGQRRVGKKGLFHFSTMFSVDAFVTGQRGYPLLFQSGETAFGEPLVDRQHPHDLFSELSVSYARSFSPDADAYVYVGYPGEPALGATTFMHRASGMDNPDAPISHHWIDATHITFGVTTLGFRWKDFKLEGSSFTGREPGENRYNFDKPRFDSRSARLWWSPNASWTMQVSHGFLKSPEALHGDEDVYRTTASASYSKQLGNGEHFFNATGLWGMNKVEGQDGEHAALLEAALRKERLVVYGRYEWVQKSGEELNLDEDDFGHDALFPVNAFTLGAGYDVLRFGPLRTSLGAQVAAFRADERLDALYGKLPFSGEVYLRIYPGLMRMQ